MMRPLALVILLFSTIWAAAVPAPTVNCDKGQSLSATLAKCHRLHPAKLRKSFKSKGRNTALIHGDWGT